MSDWLPRLSVTRPVTVIMGFLALVILGRHGSSGTSSAKDKQLNHPLMSCTGGELNRPL